ncbi:MAG TPA: polyprenyl synthetase family protein [Acidimicrobiales bacterium]|jgi:geranylgeranyl diphosphate synthase type I|nr:polyprenyl synthetase family protein [Acidimicrobiales bacterium]
MTTIPVSDAPTLAPDALGRAAALVGPALDAAVDRLSPELVTPIRHHLAGGGKRVRAALVLVSAAAAGGSEEAGIPGAVAIELVHNFSLLHDDIIDEDRDRRHRPTVWAQFGIGSAIIAGDALAALATQVLLDEPTPERVRATATLATATQEMIAGQADDMAFETRASVTVEECLRMATGKTGALLSCASSLGAVLVGAPDPTVEALADFGRNVGIAFQAIDDVLGIWGEPSQTGKPAGNDLVQHKKTLPVVTALARADGRRPELVALLGRTLAEPEVAQVARLIEESGARDEATDIAESHLEAALASLDRADLLPGPRAQLEAIAHFVTERDR